MKMRNVLDVTRGWTSFQLLDYLHTSLMLVIESLFVDFSAVYSEMMENLSDAPQPSVSLY